MQFVLLRHTFKFAFNFVILMAQRNAIYFGKEAQNGQKTSSICEI